MDEEPQVDEVLKAAENDDWEEVTRLCTEEMGISVKEETFPFDKAYHKEGPDYEYNKCRAYKTALEMAAISGHLECFKFLAENNLFYSDGIRQQYGNIIDASRRKDVTEIQKLLSGYNLSSKYDGNNLLSLFVLHGCPPSCLQLLIDKGVNIDHHDNNGLTPLMCAVLTENVSLVRFLLGAKSDVDMGTVEGLYVFRGGDEIQPDDEADYMGISALMYAACFKNNESLRVILQFCSDNEVDFDIDMGANIAPWAPIDYAVFFGHKDSVELLIKFGAGLEQYHFDERNYLGVYHMCMSHHRPDILLLTLEVAENPFYCLFSHTDICVSDIQCLQVLLTYMNGRCGEPQRDVYLIQLLEAAILGDQVESINLLSQQELKINVKDERYETVLMRMSSDDKCEGHLDTLFEFGADVHVENWVGNTAIVYAVRNNAVKCLHKLMSHGASIHHVSHYDWHEKGETALMVACKEGHDEIVDILIKHGSDVNTPDGKGKTAIMHAAVKSRDKCLKLLLAEGPDLDLSDKQGGTVFSFAMLGNGGSLDVLLHTGKLLSDGMLKPEHKHAMRSMTGMNRINVKCLILTMGFGIFEWDWCSLFSNCLRSLAFAAVISGISPGRFRYKDAERSPLHLAFMESNISLILYLLANRYLLPEDLRIVSTDIAVKEGENENCLEILERLTVELPSLQTLSFLTVSKAESLAASVPGRASMVDDLPLPVLMKKRLQFKTNVSQICPLFWDKIGIDESFESFNFRGGSLLGDNLVNCSDSCTSCDGLGLKV